MTHPLAPLQALRQWILVKLVPLANGKTDKLPVDYRTGQVTEKGTDGAHNPAIWLDHATAATTVAAWGAQYTIGFVLTAADPFFCLDIDGARLPTGEWSPLAVSLCQALPGTVIEVSQSGNGLHVWGQGFVPEHRKKNVVLRIELYTERRFIAIGTGQVGDMTQPCGGVASVVAAYFAPMDVQPGTVADTGPCPEWRGPADDDELLRRAMQSRSASATFGNGATFADLWHADVAALARAYPPDTSSSEPFDRSSADAALASHLAFWTGRDVARIDRLMRRSALKRDKWDERSDYLVERTIGGACRVSRDVLQDKPLPAPPVAVVDVGPAAPTPPPAAPPNSPTAPGVALTATVPQTAMMTARNEQTMLGAEAQAALFAGCVYVTEAHRVLCPGGHLYKPDQFKARFGGRSFVMDAQNAKVSRDPFEAFTQSQILRAPAVDGTCFRPALPYGTIVETEGRTRVNVYWPAKVPRVAGDVTPFMSHLTKLLPDAKDRAIMLYYMAGCVQFAGHKFQWFPLLVGVEGNGKSFLSQCVAAAVGQRYTHWPPASKLGNQFNSWMFGKLLYCIEDLQIGDQAELWETLKPMITGQYLEIEGKGLDQIVAEIVGNFIANSNHRDAIRATLGDRRVCHLWTAQETVEDLIRDGMVGTYMSDLYDWARDGGGYAAVAEFLHTLVIPPEFGLNWLMGRAPRTSSTGAAQRMGMGRIEQEILERVDLEAQGFRGGYVSSHFLDLHLAASRGPSLAPNKRREMMKALGYVLHPALPDGRVTGVVLPDGTKPRLYLRMGHPDLALTTPADVARAYTAAQT